MAPTPPGFETAKASLNAVRLDALRADGVAPCVFHPGGRGFEGVYATLNGGVGSRDALQAVAENRARMAAELRISPAALLVPFQVHSSHVITVSAPWTRENRPRCDGLVTATPGLALGVTGADCGMVLFADPCAKIIGAAHAGWKGALNGVVEATVAAMVSLGAKKRGDPRRARACIAQESYEVGSEFYGAFASGDPGSERFFVASERDAERKIFDLHGYIADRARRAGFSISKTADFDTYADEARFFSYRRMTHRKELDYGRLVAAIALRVAAALHADPGV